QMGKVNKKSALKRKLAADVTEDEMRSKTVAVEEPVVPAKPSKKQKKVEKIVDEEPEEVPMEEGDEEEEEVDDESIDGEDVSDEEGDEDEDEEESDDESEEGGDFLKETGEKIDFNIEAFPLEEQDKEGVNNMLTQIFLRADIDLVGLGKALISQEPTLGSAIGPAEDNADEDNTTSNVVYGLITMLAEIDKEEKYAKDIFALLKTRATKVVSSVAKDFDAVLSSSPRLGLFVNERMLHFPDAIAPPAFASLLKEKKEEVPLPSHLLYIHKIRIVEDEGAEKEEEQTEAPSTSGGKKKKKGKAEKKRLAAAALASKEVEFDNAEDAMLLHLPVGTAVHFDYQCHSDVDPGSKFSIVRKDNITKMPYRRAVIMDLDRFKAFLQAVAN
ncbi:hypothetical protein PENTCL1PPCAC_7773, partial [Pristionchus entomophagus]